MNDNNEKKQAQNLFKVLQKDPKSAFYLETTITKKILKKLDKSKYAKDQVFKNIYNELNEKELSPQKDAIPLRTPFIEQKAEIDRSTLYSIEEPLKKFHADIADLRFFAQSAADPKYALLVVDLFTSKVFIYPMKNRKLLARKLNIFYDEIDNKRNGKISLQTDLEFKQNEIKKLNEKYNVSLFHSRLRGGKAFAAEQKIREFKKILLKTKRFIKRNGDRLRPNEAIKKAVENMNETISRKYGVAPEAIENNIITSEDGEFNKEMFDFQRIKAVDGNISRLKKYNNKKNKNKRKLRSPLLIDEKVLVFAERLKKKDAPSKFFKASTDNTPFFNRQKIFKIYKRAKLEDGTFLYWIEDENYNKIKDRFIRQELFALNKQFLE